MASIRGDVNRAAQDLSRVAQDAAYVAIGLGVVGFQRAQVARRELMQQIEQRRVLAEGPLGEARAQAAKAWKDLDGAVSELFAATDATFEPIAELLPSQARQALKQAQEARDQLRHFLKEQLAVA